MSGAKMVSVSAEFKVNDYCRVCLNRSDTLVCLFSSFEDDGESLAEMLMLCASVQVEENDDLPGQVCFQCSESIRSFFKFRQLSHQSDMLLRRLITKPSLEELNKTLKTSTSPPEAKRPPANEASTELFVHRKTYSRGKPYQCNLCSKGYATSAALDLHIIEHGKLLSEAATNALSTSRQLKKDLFECTLCENSFKTAADLLAHRKLHAKENARSVTVADEPEQPPVKKKAPPAPPQPPVKTTPSKRDSETQTRFERNIAPFSKTYLSLCEKQIEDKPHKCKWCEKRFKCHMYLLMHEKVHLKEAVYTKLKNDTTDTTDSGSEDPKG